MTLSRRFFARPTQYLALALLGCVLCRSVGGRVLRGRIVEVEAYTDDPASHSRGGKRTPRNAIMFGPPGTRTCTSRTECTTASNVVSESDGVPARCWCAAPRRIDDANGPARLCQAAHRARGERLDLTAGRAIWIERGRRRASSRADDAHRDSPAAELPGVSTSPAAPVCRAATARRRRARRDGAPRPRRRRCMRARRLRRRRPAHAGLSLHRDRRRGGDRAAHLGCVADAELTPDGAPASAAIGRHGRSAARRAGDRLGATGRRARRVRDGPRLRDRHRLDATATDAGFPRLSDGGRSAAPRHSSSRARTC